MDWITEQIAIGNYREAQDVGLLQHHGFRSVLSLDGTLTESHAGSLGLRAVVAVQLIDGPGNDLRLFRLAVASLAELVREHAPVLVHCHAGRSRSVAVVVGHLARSCEMDVEDALALVKRKRQTNLSEALADLLFRL